MVQMHCISLRRILFFSFSEQYTFLKIKTDIEQELILESNSDEAAFLALSLVRESESDVDAVALDGNSNDCGIWDKIWSSHNNI